MAGDDLPADAKSVVAPAATTLGAALSDQRIPQPVDVVLIVTGHLKADGLAVGESRPAIESDVGLTEKSECGRQDITLGPLRVTLVIGDVTQLGVGKEADIKFRRIFRLSIEP